MKSVAVLGASQDRQKFGNKAVRAFKKKGFVVYPINPKHTEVERIPCYPSIQDIPRRPDLITVYLPPEVLQSLLPVIAAKDCDELWLNPGSESQEVLAEAKRLELNVITACSIAALGLDPSNF